MSMHLTGAENRKTAMKEAGIGWKELKENEKKVSY